VLRYFYNTSIGNIDEKGGGRFMKKLSYIDTFFVSILPQFCDLPEEGKILDFHKKCSLFFLL
jgi:hypothetical protein